MPGQFLLSRRKITIWNFFYLNLRSVITIANGILIVPLYLHYISNPLYGAWLATGNIMMWISIADPGVGDVLLQKIGNALAKEDKKEIGMAISSGSVISLITFTLILSLGLVSATYVAQIIKYTGNDAVVLISCFRIALLGTCLSLLANTTNNILLGFQKTKEFGFFSTLITVSSIMLTILLLIMGYGLFAIAYTYLARGFVLLIYSTGYCYLLLRRSEIPYKLDWIYTKKLFRTFFYTFSGKLVNAISGNIDLIIISRYIGPQSVTILELSRRPIRIMAGLANNITISALPAFSYLSGTDEREKIRKIVMDAMIFILWYSTLIIGGFLLFSQSLIGHWVGKENYFGNINNVLSSTAFFLLSITYSISNIVYTFGDIRKNNIMMIARNLAYLSTVVILVKYMGIRGELLAFLISIVVVNCTYYPLRIVRIAHLTQADIGQFLREFSPAVLLLAICSLISLYFKYELSIRLILLYGSLYLICFSIYAGIMSVKAQHLLKTKMK